MGAGVAVQEILEEEGMPLGDFFLFRLVWEGNHLFGTGVGILPLFLVAARTVNNRGSFE